MKPRSVMNHRTVIERKTPTSDTGGGYTEEWASVQENVPCHAWTVGAQEIVQSARPDVVKTRLVLMPNTIDVQTGDRLAPITDRKGKVLFDGPLLVDGIGEHPSYNQLTTRKIS